MLNGRIRYEQTRRAEGTSATMNDAGSDERTAERRTDDDARFVDIGRSRVRLVAIISFGRTDGRIADGGQTDGNAGKVRGMDGAGRIRGAIQ